MTETTPPAEADGLRTQYLVFTVGETDILASVRSPLGDCPGDADVRRMQVAALAAEKAGVTDPRDLAHHALRSAGYADYDLVHVGLICRIEL